MNKLLLSISVALWMVAFIDAGPIPEEFEGIAPAIRRNCLKKSGVPVELVERAVNGDFADDQALKCYIKCVFDRFRLVSKKGFAYDAFVKMSPLKYKEMATNAVANCRGTEGKPDDMCDLAFNMHKCFYNVAPNEYFLI